MRVTIEEFNGCFSVDLEAENLQDGAKIARLGMNATKELRGIYASAEKDGSMRLSVVIGKKKHEISYIKSRK